MRPPRRPSDPVSRFFEAVPQRLLAWWRRDRHGSHIQSAIQLLLAPPELAQRRQFNNLRAFLIHSYNTTRYHRERMDAAGVDPRSDDPYAVLKALPPLDKVAVVERLDELLSTDWRREDLWTSRSGGTTGTPVPFYLAREDAILKDDIAAAMRRIMGWFRGERIAYLWGAPRDLPAVEGPWHVRAKGFFVNRWIHRRLFLPANGLDAARLDEYVDRVRSFHPHWMQGYPSAMDIMARHVLSRGVRCPIDNVALTAEPTLPAQRARIAKAFETNVVTWYGSRECAWIAAECRQEQRLHVNHVQHVLETTPDGRLLVTDLLSRAMPLIRYDIGDLAVLGTKPCPCGDPRPTIESLEGRAHDVLELPSGTLVPGVVLGIRGIQGIAPGIFEAQFLQEDVGSVDVYYTAGPNFKPSHEEWLRKDIARSTNNELVIRLHAVAELKREANGKIRYCVSRPYEARRAREEAVS